MRFSVSPSTVAKAWPPALQLASTGRSVLLVAWVIIACTCIDNGATAQPPGTVPPSDVFTPPKATDSPESAGGLPIRAFMFLSESQSPVMMPDLTWEELERLQNLDAGTETSSQAYSYQSLEITGTAADERAELSLTLRLSIESTDNNWIAIPLRMGNFHRLAPPDVSGVEEYRMTLTQEGAGYVLWVKTTSRRDVTLRMNVSARVEVAATQSLDFQLPDVPSTVQLTAAAANVTGDVIGRGYETIETKKIAGGRTQFIVESVGGTFTLRWGRLANENDDAPHLEVTSRINVNWDSPQDSPRVAVQLTLKNVRSSIDSFEIQLPPGSVVPESASLGVGGQSVSFGPPISDGGGDRHQILIPKVEQQQRIDLNFSFNVQLPSGNISATNPLAFRVPEVVGAIRHRGEITIQTSEDYRLRWNAEPWVRSVLSEASDETIPGRSYSFQFDRGSFELPLWLSAKERQVRITANSRISVREKTATLEMVIRSSGRAADGRGPQIDLAGWSLQSIENAETNQPMATFEGDGFPEIDIPPGPGEPPTIRLRAQHPIDPGQDRIVIKVPRIVKTDGGLLVPTSTVDVVNSGRTMLVVNLEASKNLERIVSLSEAASDLTVSRFRVISHATETVIAGTIEKQPPRITLASDGTIVLDGNELQTTIDWSVTSRMDLEGRLPIRIPNVVAATNPSGEEVGLAGENPVDDQSSTNATGLWSVRVDSVPAQLQRVGDDRYDLISPGLADGTMLIRWHRTQQLNPAKIGDSTESLALPRPAIEDVTVSGEVRIALKGNHATELLSAATSASELRLDSLPPEPVRLRLKSREAAPEELTVRQLVLRTAVGRTTRHEQILASIQGGESFQVGLPSGVSEVSVEAFIDQQAWPVRREGDSLILSLPGDQASRVIDLRVWLPEPSSSSIAMIEPAVRLPVGVGRVYWQIIAPGDSHAIWASATIGRSMTWKFSRWKLDREASHDDRALAAMVGGSNHAMPPGNRYLYVGSDVRSFQVVLVSRVVLWLSVGAIVLLTTFVLTQFSQARHPLTAVTGAVLFAGLLAIAPDAAVLVGQFGIIALVLVIVMIAVRSLVTPAHSDRIIAPRDVQRRAEASTQSLSPPAVEKRSSITQTAALPSSPTEAPS